MTVTATHLCRTCRAEDNLTPCKTCYTAYYCSDNCQKEDKKSHKQFCVRGEGAFKEMARSYACLSAICATENFTAHYLLEQRYDPEQLCFIRVTHQGKVKVFKRHDLATMQKANLIYSEVKHHELTYECERNRDQQAMVLLHTFHKREWIYLIKTNELKPFLPRIMSLERELINQIFDIGYQEMRSASPKKKLASSVAEYCMMTGQSPWDPEIARISNQFLLLINTEKIIKEKLKEKALAVARAN